MKHTLLALGLALVTLPLHNALRAAPCSPHPTLSKHGDFDVERAVKDVADAKLDVEAMTGRIDAYLPRIDEDLQEGDVVAAWEYFSSELALLENHCATLGTDTGALLWVDQQSFPVNNFGAFDYTQFYADECEVLATLTEGQYNDPRVYLAAVRMTGNAALIEEGVTTVIASKLIAALGLKTIAKAFDEILTKQAGATLKAMGTALARKEVKTTAKLTKRLLKTIVSSGFRKALVRKVGKKAATAAIAKIAGRAVPFVGWAIIAGSIAWTLWEQYSEPAG
ncbi:MAG TPA: hypothetical protein EYQ59_00395 [Planctomycetes bacterium]|nr:hypothetical protein [Planctomycetota bacterium]